MAQEKLISLNNLSTFKDNVDVLLDEKVKQVKVGTTEYNPTDGVVSLPAYPTSLPASNTTDTYSSTGTDPVSGKAVNAALGTLDVTGESNISAGKTIKSWSETDGKVSVTTQDISITKSQVSDFPTLGTAAAKDVPATGNASTSQVVMGNDTRLSDARPASDVSAWAKAASKPSYTASEVGLGNVTNNKQIKGLASGTTENHVVTFGTDGYTVKDSGFTIGKSVPSDAKFTDTTYSNATTAVAGLMSTDDKSKLNGIAAGAEVNQNTFSNVKVGSTTVAADAKTDTIELVQGSNITLTPDATNDKITIAATNTTYSNATTAVAGLMSTTDKSKLDGIASGAEVNQNAFSSIDVTQGSTTTNVAADSKTDKLTLVAGSNVTLTPDATNDKITISSNNTTYSNATTTTAGLMSAADKAKVDALGTAANKNVPASGNASTAQVVMGNDTRLSDSRNAKDVYSWAKAANKPSYTASEVGAIATSAKGAASGVAELDANGKVPAAQLPSYVDDVLEYTSKSAFPATGETGKIYVATDTNLTYRWSGSAYVEISPSLALGETSSTAYRGDRGKTAYDHSQATGNPHGTTKANVGLGNVANIDQSKAIKSITRSGTTFTATALDGTTSSFSQQDNNTTYTFANGTNGFTVTPSGGSAQTVTVTPNDSTKLPLAGGTLTGAVEFKNGKMPLSSGKITGLSSGASRVYGDGIAISNPTTANDVGFIRVLGTGENDTVLEIATGDDGGGSTAETIAVRQYNTSSAIAKEAKLLDPSGNTSFPGTVTANSFVGSIASATGLTKSQVTTALGYTPPTTNTTYSNATTATAGLMSKDDKVKLNGIAAGATANTGTVTSVGLTAGDGIAVSGGPVTTSGSITVSNKGVRAVATGGSNGTINVNTNGTTADVPVKGLGAMAYKASVSKSDVGLGNVANYDQSKAIKSITRSGTTFTATAIDGTTSSFTQQDNNTTYANVSTTAAGLAPKITDTSKFLKGDGTWATPTNTTYSNVSSASAGLAPKGAAVSSQSQNTKFLREDGSWAKPSYTTNTNTTYTFANGTNGFTVTPSGGTAQTVTVTPSITNNVTGSGTSGYIAKFNGGNTITNGPAIGSDTTKYLRNDGTWVKPPNDNTTYSNATTAKAGLMSTTDKSKLDGVATGANAVSIAESSSNGNIKVTTNGSTANVPIHGLGSAAYTASTAYAASGHTHATSIATSSGTNQITLAANTKYAITAGGTSYVFTTPPDTNTWRGIQNNLTSDSTSDSLSAAQGKVLKTLIGSAFNLFKDGSVVNPNTMDQLFGILNGWDSNKQNFPPSWGNQFGLIFNIPAYPTSNSTAITGKDRMQVAIAQNGESYSRWYENNTWTSWKDGAKVGNWLPANGYNPRTSEPGYFAYSVNPSLMVNQGCPYGFSEYATVFGCGSNLSYPVMLYTDVFGSLAVYNQQGATWRRYGSMSISGNTLTITGI